MPWKECDALDQRAQFVFQLFRKDVPFSELCREFGISRKTGYKWRERFVADGLGGLHDESRRPHQSPEGLLESVVCDIVRLKERHKNWGPYKIRQVYARTHKNVPSASSFKRVLDRAGLVEHRKKRQVQPQDRLTSSVVAERPNDIWTVDFKGWWKMLGGERCEPLTIRDHCTKYVLCVQAMESARTDAVRRVFERLFIKHGLPRVILSDNGPPFALRHSLLGLTRLSAWWVSLGIKLHRTRPGKPQDNGGHERMHRDISMELQGHVVGDTKEHQAAFDVWRHEYNWVRPHAALDMKVPGDLYRNSDSSWNGTTPQLSYGLGFIQRKVNSSGIISLGKRHIPISRALAGYDIGIKGMNDEMFEAWFDYLLLGEIDLAAEKLIPVCSGN
jgi:putative transposase